MKQALALLAISSCATGTPLDAKRANEIEPLADDVSIGGCAAVRYRAIEPGEIESDARVPRSPPPPVSFRVTPGFTSKAAHKTIARTLATSLRKAKRPILACVDEELEEDKGKHIRISLVVNRAGVRLTRVHGVNNSDRRVCTREAVSQVLKATSPSHAYLNFSIIIGPRPRSESVPSGPRRKRGTVEVLSNQDRADDGLILAAAVIKTREAMTSCLSKHKQRGHGLALATLIAAKGTIESAEVETTDGSKELGQCWASAFSGIEAVGVDAGGFQCALAYGSKTQHVAELALAVDERGLVTSADDRVEIETTAKPPNSGVFQALLKQRFDDRRPSPAPASLTISDGVRGAELVAVLNAARAADIEITRLSVGNPSAATSSNVPRPKLGPVAARAAVTTAIVTDVDVWLGLTQRIESSSFKHADSAGLRAHMQRLAKTQGIAGRRDALLGVADNATAKDLTMVLAELKAAGFDQIQVTSAERAHSQLAE